MHPQIITVDDIHGAIKDVGIKSYADRLIQDMAGNYFYVEVEEAPDIKARPGWLLIGQDTRPTDVDCMTYEAVLTYYRYRVVEIPKQLAFFVIDTLKLKAQVMEIGTGDYSDGFHGGKNSVYLTPGKELFGHKIERLTEIPAQLRPVVVERL